MSKETNPLYKYQKADILYRAKQKKVIEKLNDEKSIDNYLTRGEQDRIVTFAGFIIAISIMYGINKCSDKYEKTLIKKVDSIEHIKKDSLENILRYKK